MFAYGTSFLLYLEWENDAGWPLLLLPAVCAVISIVVAALCFRRNATEKTDRVEAIAFSTDVWLTLIYLGIAWRLGTGAAVNVGFLIATNLTAVTAFLPVIRSTWQAPYRELPGPWVVWTLAYALLGVATWMADGGQNPVLFVYPVLNMVLHGLVAAFSLREEVKVTRYFDRAKSLYLQRSRIEGVGLFAGRTFQRGEPIWQMTGRLVGGSLADEDPNYIGVGRDLWIDPDQPFDRLNHSCAANAAFGAKHQLYALRTIAPNEEITLDYSTTEADPDWTMTCACGHLSCRQTLGAIQIDFADAVEAPPASPLMQAIWRRERLEAERRDQQPMRPPAMRGDEALRVRSRRGVRGRRSGGFTLPGWGGPVRPVAGAGEG